MTVYGDDQTGSRSLTNDRFREEQTFIFSAGKGDSDPFRSLAKANEIHSSCWTGKLSFLGRQEKVATGLCAFLAD